MKRLVKHPSGMYGLILTPGELWLIRGFLGKHVLRDSHEYSVRSSDLYGEIAEEFPHPVGFKDKQGKDLDHIETPKADPLYHFLVQEAEEPLE